MTAPAIEETGVPTGAIAAAWILSVGFDFFLHGGLLARLYLDPSPFLLSAREALRRIPLGYGAFLILTIALSWLLRRLRVRGWAAGFRYGGAAGAIVWGSFAVGLYSISTVTLPLVASWWAGQSIELALAGAVLGAAANRMPMKRIWAIVVAAVLCCIIATVILQSLGLAPAMETGGGSGPSA